MTLLKNIEKHYGRTAHLIEKFQTGNYGETFKILLDSEAYVVKIIPDVEQSDLNQTFAFSQFITTEGMQVPCPLKTLKGHWFCKGVHQGKKVLYYVYPLLKGNNLEDSIEAVISTGLLKSLGKELAKLHQTMHDYHHKKTLDIKRWDETEGLMVIYEEVHQEIPREIIQRYDDSRKAFEKLNLRFDDLIHNDMHMANILYHESTQSFSFIDLDECVLGSRVMDLAILCFDLSVVASRADLWSKGITDLLAGYEELMPLKTHEKQAIPIMLKMLETASYVNFYTYREEADPWLQSFYHNRTEKIVKETSNLQNCSHLFS